MLRQKKDFLKIVQPLLQWYDAHARVLPWRENTEPYRVWISEIMLQQTRVEAVIPYYNRFLQALPTIESLANASEETLMKLWEGLGYYSRMRNLQKAAIRITECHGGVFPRTFEKVLALPGIGEYTAGAICSICFGQAAPAVDGNVIRVFSRLAGGELSEKKEIGKILTEIYPENRCGDFTQCLMELGATVCIPSDNPRCDACPVRDWCEAYRLNAQAHYPVKIVKKQRRVEERTVLMVSCGDKIAIKKRDPSGLLAGLWEFPNLPGNLSIAEVLSEAENRGLRGATVADTANRKHIFTHVEWKMKGYRILCDNETKDWQWIPRQQLLHEIPLPTAFKGFLTLL